MVKAGCPGHMAENLQAWNASLTTEEVRQIGALGRKASCFGVDPRTFVAPKGFEHFQP